MGGHIKEDLFSGTWNMGEPLKEMETLRRPLFFLTAALTAFGCSWARDGILATAATYTTPMATLDP